MIRGLTILTALAIAVLLFFALLANAQPSTVFYAQTAAGLIFIILLVVLVASAVTTFYLVVFGKLTDSLAKRRIARFIAWKFLRSQQTRETRRSRIVRSFEALARGPRGHRLTLLGLGLALTLWALAMTRPALWNTVAEAVSPAFATALHGLSLVLGRVQTPLLEDALAVSLAALLYPARREREPALRQRLAVTLPTRISIVGVAIGLWALISVLGVMHGLQSDLRDKILRTNAHLVLEPKEPDGVLSDPLALTAAVKNHPGVVEALPFLRGEVMMSSTASIAVNVVVKGMDPADLERSEQLAGKVIDGSIAGLERPESLLSDRARHPIEFQRKRKLPTFIAPPEPPPGAPGSPSLPGEGLPDELLDDVAILDPSAEVLPGILLGAELARQLHVGVGEELQLISPDGDIGPTGVRPKLASFRVAGVFQTGMYEYDQKLAYTALYSAQRFFDLGRDLNALEARFSDPELALEEMATLSTELAAFPEVTVSSFRDRNKNLFSALALERIIMLLILGFIVFVASLLIVSSLVMLVVEKVREIAVLKALGAADHDIVKSFVNIGAFIGLFGVLSGVPLGVGSLVALIAQGVTLPREFYITELPVKLDGPEIAILSLAAFAMCLLATLYPSRKASQLRPADGLRHG
ncbi:MAG TPA: ABC transporter permease [Myxococcota bacterium]|nr:ABC transporter permease [Myxococcota bacterium]